jgi:heme/copper-type cytochrome/quinol oxidase subunit 3
MHALPAGPPPAPRRQLFVGTAIICAALAALLGGMMALYLRLRDQSLSASGHWLPEDVQVPMVPANLMLCAMAFVAIVSQWAVYAARRNDRVHTGAALWLVVVLAAAIINAQINIYERMNVPATGATFNTMFYALTGAMVVLFIAGGLFSAVTAFRYLGGRTTERELVSAHALYWYFLSFAFSMLWFVIYVTK